MKKFLCYDTNDAASGKISVSTNGVLSPNATVPSTNGTPYQQLVTDGEGSVKWEDRLAYASSSRIVVNNNWVYVSDEIPDGQMYDRNPCTFFFSDGKKQDSLLVQRASYILNAGPVMFVLADNIEYLGAIFPKRGVYFEKSSGIYVSGFSFRDSSAPEIAWDGKIENVKTIDPKYIPSKEAFFVLSGPGFRTGTDWDAGEDVTIADIVTAYHDGGARIFQMSSGKHIGISNVIGASVLGSSSPFITYYDYSAKAVFTTNT